MDKTIEQKQQSWLSEKLSSQTFWVFIAVVIAFIYLSFATDSFATSKNLYNITRNVTFVAIIALGMTLVIITGGIDLSVGSVLCLCSMVLGVVMHAGYSIEVGIAASLGTALPTRPAGTEGWSEEQLAEIVTRDCLIGVAVPKPGVKANAKRPVHPAVHPVHHDH